jgi:hypothetical protein
MPLQLAKVPMHVPMVQAEAAQFVPVLLGRVGQTVPQPPQLFGLLVMLISQPSVRLLALQSAKPVAQVPVQFPPEQAAVMLLVEQAMPQPPHAVAVALVSVSQPSERRLALQSARPVAQVPLHVPAAQVRVAMPVAEHAIPQPLQLSGSMAVSRQVPLQTASEPQLTWQVPPEHT